ncbi:preprotein translocase subunit SecE [Pedobacter agri]|nr:preprotein translocase subunit SecE [Pedobacter agri]
MAKQITHKQMMKIIKQAKKELKKVYEKLEELENA